MAQANPFTGHALPNPELSEAEAAAVLEAHFGVRGTLRALGSTQDQNFRVDGPEGRYVLRIETARAVRSHVEAQNAAMRNAVAAGDVVRALAGEVPDERRRALALDAVAAAEARIAPLTAGLRTQVIHGDVTDWNVIARRDAAGRLVPVGLIDFGDVLVSWLVAELAV